MDRELRELRRRFEECPSDRAARASFIRALGRASPGDPVHELLLLGVDATPTEVERILRSPGSAVVMGERGTAKEPIARVLHAASGRSAARFEAFSVRAMSPLLAPSKLFGDAVTRGAIIDMTGGTLFVDDVDEVWSDLGNDFVRAIREKEIRPLGTPRPIRVDVRFIFGTPRGLRGTRPRSEDVATLRLLPLRERSAELSLILERVLGEEAPGERVLAELARRSWSENDAELASLAGRAQREGWETALAAASF